MGELADLFRFTVPPWELVLRGAVLYVFLFLLLRFVLRRDAGALGLADILLLVLIADAGQNAMAGGYETISEGLLLISTIVSLNWLMNWASFRFPAFRRLTEAEPLVLVRRGRLLARNLRREFVTVPELMASLREQGIDKLAQVKIARMETDGSISVIRWHDDEGPPARHDDRGLGARP